MWDEALSPFPDGREAGRVARAPVLRSPPSFGTHAIHVFNIYGVHRMMGHRHLTTTERYLHYAPDPDAAAKLSGLWGASEGSGSFRLAASLRRLLGSPMGSLATTRSR